MTKLTTSLAMVAALLVGGLIAVPAAGGIQTACQATRRAACIRRSEACSVPSGIKTAESTCPARTSITALTLTVDTHPALPPERKPEFDSAKDNADKAQVFEALGQVALRQATRPRGSTSCICKSPAAVVVLADKETRNRGFTQDNADKLRDIVR